MRVAQWFNEILALLKLLNDLPEGCIDAADALKLRARNSSQMALYANLHRAATCCPPSYLFRCLGNSGDIARAVSSFKESLCILKSAKVYTRTTRVQSQCFASNSNNHDPNNPMQESSIDTVEISNVSYNLASFYATHWALSDAEHFFLEAVGGCSCR